MRYDCTAHFQYRFARKKCTFMEQILPRDFPEQSRTKHMARMRGVQERTDEITMLKIFVPVDGHVKLMFGITHDTLATEFIRDILIDNHNFIA